MRAIVFSGVVAALLLACGSRPSIQSHIPSFSGPTFLDVNLRVSLKSPHKPVGTILRIAVTEQRELFLLDADHHRVIRYTNAGIEYGQVGGSGAGALQFSGPVDIASDGLTMWVLDRQNQRMVRLDRALNFVEEIDLAPAVDDFDQPLWYDAISCASNGDIFLLDRREPQAVRLSPSGEILATYGGFGMSRGRLEQPTDLAAGRDGSLYITDGPRLLHFSRSGSLKSIHEYTEPLVRVATSRHGTWLITRSSQLVVLEGQSLRKAIIDPKEGSPRLLDVCMSRSSGPIVLTAGPQVWNLSSGE